MLTPREFKRTRAARPRPDLGGDDLADLGSTCWCVGRISTDKHLSIGKAHAVRPKIGLYWPPVVARVGRRPWRCRCGLPYWWPPVLADAVAVRRGGGRPWLVYWLAVLAAGVRPPCWRSVRGWCPSVAVVAVFVAAGGLSAVRWSIGPPWSFRGRWRPVWALCACLSFGSVPPPLVARRRWCAVLVLACLVCAVGGRGGRVAGRPCWCRWCRCHCAVPWPVVRVAGQPCRRVACVLVSLRRPVVGRVPWSVRPCWCPPWSVAGRVHPSLLVCWCAVGGWRPFIAVFRGRGGPFGPSVVLVSVAGPCGPCGPCFGPCRLAGRVGLASGWRRWLAVLALAVVLALSKNVGPWLAGGGPCAVLSVVVASACLAGGPCWCRTSGGRGRPSNQRTKHQRPPWRPC